MDEIKGIVCPYCKHEHKNWQEYLDFEEMLQEFKLDCEKCDLYFDVKCDTTPRFEVSIPVFETDY